MVRALTAAMMLFSLGAPPALRPAPECVRLGGSQIGQLPLIVELAGQRVEFLEWKATDITASELVGFTANAPDGVRFTVEAGRATYAATENWLHPAGVVGPQVQPIRSLTLCAN